ncbi:hypothetical protein J3R30DRAFT_1838352 [Lentinula aciculospora]|uniref:Uncharacterized protein n=1 Tax=Lentinula aciculospora TaxID=153920 RepID=A0A9W9AIV8_9AGAR|nr:hypothetical protein J3R30DRAFT_1838352 [Lentinula aciculospora]
MVFVLSTFSFALFFFLSVFSLSIFWRCTFTRRDLASIVGLVIFGFLGVAEAVTGILGSSTGIMVSCAVLDGFSGMTTNALLISSIYKINQHRESPIVPNINLAVYAVFTSLFVICGTVLSLTPGRVSPSSLLRPLFYLLSATTVLPLLVYMFLTTVPGSTNKDNLQASAKDIRIPEIPTTPKKHQSHHLALPLSPSFLSLSSTPPSPAASNRTLASTAYPDHSNSKECASLDLSPTHIHPIQLKTGMEASTVFDAKKRPATSPFSSREQKKRSRPPPLDLARQVETRIVSRGVLPSRTPSSNYRQQQHPRFGFRFRNITSQSVGDLTSIAHEIWSFLLVAQAAVLLAQGLRICIQVVLSELDNSESKRESLGIGVTMILQNLFFVVQAACIMCALTSYIHFGISLRSNKPSPISVNADRTYSPFPTSTKHHRNCVNESDSLGPVTSGTPHTTPFRTSFLLSQVCAKQEDANVTRLDEDVEKGLRVSSRETNLEALDLAFPLTQISDNVLETIPSLKPMRMDPDKHTLCQSLAVSVYDGSEVHCTQVAMTTNRNGSDPFSHPLNAFAFGSPSIAAAEAEAPEAINKEKSTVIFPSISFDEVQIPDSNLGKQEIFADKSSFSHPSPSKLKKDSSGSKSLKHSRLPSILSLSSLSSSLGKSRLRSFSLTGKRRTYSTATASIMDWSSESLHPCTTSLSRSSSFCSPRPKRRALPSAEAEVKHRNDPLSLCDLVNRQNQVESEGHVDVFGPEYSVPRMRRPDALFPDNRTLSPLPFASYLSDNTSHISECLHPVSMNQVQRPPLRPTRSATFHIFPNFDALASLGALGAKLSRGLSGGRSPSPTPTRMLRIGTDEGIIGMRSPTPRSMGGIMEMTRVAVRSPSRLGMDLLRTDGPLVVTQGVVGDSSGDEDLVQSKLTKSYGQGWKHVESDDEDYPAYNIELRELRTPKKLRPYKEDRWTSPSKIPRLRKTTALDSPGSQKSIFSDTEMTPTTVGIQTPRTPFIPTTPVSPLQNHTRYPQPLHEAILFNPILSSRSSPVSASYFVNKLAPLPPPSSFNSPRFRSQESYISGPIEVFNNDPDPFAGPELGAIVRDSQVGLLREDLNRDGYSQIQTATRMSAWGNLTLPVPKAKKSPGVGLRKDVSDDRNVTKRTAVAASVSPLNSSGDAESPSAYSQETAAELNTMISSEPSVVEDGQQGEHSARVIESRNSHGSDSHVLVEEALLAQRLLRRLNRRAEGRKSMSGKHKRGPQIESSGRNNARVTGTNSKVASSGGGRSFLLGMAQSKFLGYGWSS